MITVWPKIWQAAVRYGRSGGTEEKRMIQEAVNFAERAHRGAVRKGSRIPYITHPLEAAVIAASITDDPEVIAAAVLHDVLEDTDVT